MTPDELAAWLEEMADGCRHRAAAFDARYSGSQYAHLVGGYEELLRQTVTRLREMGGAR